MFDPQRDYYRILNVPETASAKEIRAAFLKLIRGAHPDKNEGRPESHGWSVALNEAYDVLRNAERRAEYDRLRGEFRQGKQVPRRLALRGLAQRRPRRRRSDRRLRRRHQA